MNESIGKAIADSIGISPAILGIIMSVALIILLGLFSYLLTMSMFLSSIALVLGSIVSVVLGFMPVWIIPVFLLLSLLTFTKYTLDGTTKPAKKFSRPTPTSIYHFMEKVILRNRYK